jgi:hypothetical protein
LAYYHFSVFIDKILDGNQMREDIINTLDSIKKNYGEASFNSPNEFKIALDSITINHDADTIRNLLRIAICDLMAFKRLKKAFNNNDSFEVNNLASDMSTNYMIDQTASLMVMVYIFKSL